MIKRPFFLVCFYTIFLMMQFDPVLAEIFPAALRA